MTDDTPGRTAFRVSLSYAVVALLWILGTDFLARIWVADPDLEMWVESLKGAAFALLTGFLLFWWFRGELQSREAALRDLRTLAEHVPDLIFRLRLRPELKFEYVSPAAVDLAGFTPEEHYEHIDRVLAAVHPDDRDRLRQLIDDPDSIDRSLELRWIHKDGRTVWVEFHVARHRDEEGRVDVVEGIARDVTDRRKAEERNALLATAVDAVGDMVMITDTRGRIEYVNPTFTEVTGYRPDEAIGKTPRILKSGRQDEAFYEELWTTVTAGRTFRGKMVNRRKDGTLYDQEATITPVRRSGDAVTHFVAVARDVTVRNEMERQLHRSYKMDAVGQMAAGISHDFRNLLNVIQVNAQLLKDDLRRGVPGTVDDSLQQVEAIESSARAGSELVGNLLTLARERELDLEALDLSRVLEDAETACRALLPESVSLEVRAEEELIVKADEGSLHHVLLNLVTNAGQATAEGGSVTIELSGVRARPGGGHDEDPGGRLAPYARLAVTDTGQGIDRETLPRIFDPFFTTRAEGTGLGLAMVRTLVQQHGGFVHVESRRGEGATFELYFPRAETMGRPKEVESRRDGPDSGLPRGSERILLVEDEVPLRDAARRALTRLGYSVATASNGREALEMAEREEFRWALVLTDLVMPEMGGADLYDHLQKKGIDTPFVFMSGYGPEEHAVPPNPDRIRLFLQKPWTIEDLAWTVREALDTRVA